MKKNLRIAFITLGFSPNITSGFDVSGERLVKGLAKRGHSVFVIAAGLPSAQPEHPFPNIEVHRVPLGFGNWINYSWRACRLLEKLEKQQEFDVVHFWDVHFAYSYQGRFVATVHQSFHQRIQALETSFRNPVNYLRFLYYLAAKKFAEETSLRKAAGLMAVSRTTLEEYRINYRIQENHIRLVRHGIDNHFFSPKPEKAAQLRSALSIPMNQQVLLFVGFITPRKGILYLAEALKMVKPAPCLILVGKWRDEKLRSKFLEVAAKSDASILELGYIPEEQLPVLYSLADIYVSPSLLEGFGMPLVEAIACGIPVVTCFGGSSAEVVGPGGILIPSRDPNALAKAIMEMMSSDLNSSCAEEGLKYIRKNFDQKHWLKETLAAYEKYLS